MQVPTPTVQVLIIMSVQRVLQSVPSSYVMPNEVSAISAKCVIGTHLFFLQ